MGMLGFITAEAPAKINLGLTVFPRRPDGYHNISSIFTTVGLYDNLCIRPLLEKNTCRVECEGMELPLENTFTKAYEAFCVLTGITEGVEVHVDKHIPAGGGLGGGSSDCASFIQAIDTLFGTRLDRSSLCDIAGRVGSDVYFFTHALLAGRERDDGQQATFAALVEGRGEKVAQIAGRDDYGVLLVFPGVFVSTKEAYTLVDGADAQNNRIPCTGQELVGMYKKPIREWFFCNDFTPPVASRYREIQRALAAVRDAGADFADMSGSGSTVFGIFEDRGHAQRAADAVAGNWRTVLV